MSASWTVYGRTQLLIAVLTPDAYSPPPSLWLALCTRTPHVNDSGETLIEPDPSTGYARILVPLGSTAWHSAAIAEFANTAPYTASGPLTDDAGLCLGWAFTDDFEIGGGNAWTVGLMVEPFAMYKGQTLQFDNAVLGLYD